MQQTDALTLDVVFGHDQCEFIDMLVGEYYEAKKIKWIERKPHKYGTRYLITFATSYFIYEFGHEQGKRMAEVFKNIVKPRHFDVDRLLDNL